MTRSEQILRKSVHKGLKTYQQIFDAYADAKAADFAEWIDLNGYVVIGKNRDKTYIWSGGGLAELSTPDLLERYDKDLMKEDGK